METNEKCGLNVVKILEIHKKYNVYKKCHFFPIDVPVRHNIVTLHHKITFHQLKCYQLCYFKGLNQREAGKQLGVAAPSICSALKILRRNYPKLFPIYTENKPASTCKKKVKYRGVYYRSVRGGFSCHASISLRINKKQKHIHLGTFGTPEQAARAYDKKAKEIWGEKAILNFGQYKNTSVFQMKCYGLCSSRLGNKTQRQAAKILGISQQQVWAALHTLEKNCPELFPIYFPNTDDRIAKKVWGEKTVSQFGHPNNVSLLQLRCYQLCSPDFYGITQTQAAKILGTTIGRVHWALKKLKRNHPMLFPLRNRKTKKIPYFYTNASSGDRFSCEDFLNVVERF